MRPATPLSRFPAFPVTFALAAMAIFVTVADKTGRTSIEPFVMSSVAFEGEPWRLVSSALPHGDWLHLAFNVIWLWVLGTRLEEALGHVTTLAIMVVLAAGSEAAEFALAIGGIGLSGIVYGIVGCLWILAKRDARFRDAIDRNVLVTFIAWGILCVALTLSDVMPIGNFAHATGFILGVLIGYALAPGSLVRRIGAGLGLVVLVGAFVAAAGWARPQINLSEHAGADDSQRGYLALGDRQYEKAARHYRRAIALDASDANAWYNYGVALQHVTDPDGLTALDAFQRARALRPDDKESREAVYSVLMLDAADALARGDLPRARELFSQAIEVEETADARWNLGLTLRREGKPADAEREFARARVLDPTIETPSAQ